MQCNAIPSHTIQFNAIQYGAIPNNTMQYNPIQYSTLQYTFHISNSDITTSCSSDTISVSQLLLNACNLCYMCIDHQTILIVSSNSNVITMSPPCFSNFSAHRYDHIDYLFLNAGIMPVSTVNWDKVIQGLFSP